jgi:DNA-binding LytR/AlgR family response regulator
MPVKKATENQLFRWITAEIWINEPKKNINNMTAPKSELIYFNSRDELLRIKKTNIVYFEADGNYTTLYAKYNQKYQVTMNLLAIEQILGGLKVSSESLFARIGKRHIINMHYVTQIQLLKQRLVLSDFTTCNYHVQLSKEALKNLKTSMIEYKP